MAIAIAMLVTLLCMHLHNRQLRYKQQRANVLMEELKEIEQALDGIETITELSFWHHELLLLKGLHSNNREAKPHFDRLYNRIAEIRMDLLQKKTNLYAAN